MSWYWALLLTLLWLAAIIGSVFLMFAIRRSWVGFAVLMSVFLVPLTVAVVVTLADRADQRETCEAKGGTLVATGRGERTCIDAREIP